MDLYAVDIDVETGRAIGDPRLVYAGLPPGGTFDVAPGGRRIVYSGGVTRTQVRLFRFDPAVSGRIDSDTSLTGGTARHVAPRISPDGQRLAYVRKTGGSEDIYVLPLSGGDAERVSMLYQWNRLMDLHWGANSRELAVMAETDDGVEVVIVPLEGAALPRRLDMPTPRGTRFGWSPNGRWIAYGSNNDAEWVLFDPSTGEERVVFQEVDGELIRAIFSPDGTRLLAMNTAVDGLGLWSEGVDGGRALQVTQEGRGWAFPVSWAEDGTIYVLAPGGLVFTVNESGGRLQPFAQLPAECVAEGGASMSADAEYLVCSVNESSESDVWVLDIIDDQANR